MVVDDCYIVAVSMKVLNLCHPGQCHSAFHETLHENPALQVPKLKRDQVPQGLKGVLFHCILTHCCPTFFSTQKYEQCPPVQSFFSKQASCTSVACVAVIAATLPAHSFGDQAF